MGIAVIVILFLLVVVAAQSDVLDMPVQEHQKHEPQFRDRYDRQEQRRQERIWRNEQKKRKAIAKKKREARNKKIEEARNKAREDVERLTKEMAERDSSAAQLGNNLNRAGIGGKTPAHTYTNKKDSTDAGAVFAPPGAVIPGIDNVQTGQAQWSPQKAASASTGVAGKFTGGKSKLSRF